ncbi:phosphate ABC transporter permease PstA [Wolbachia endosymbiont of Pentidionis agamae]|uniref:phosphate ABC transporter permease PstA n=1 Tax=Wolbachia endosymbiont of Pentidionis agamae TaxID=3110435 RepID=UPI002FD288B7
MGIRKKFLTLLKSRHIHVRIKRKNQKNKVLRFFSCIALIISLGSPICILLSILVNSYSALTVTKILLPIYVTEDNITLSNEIYDLRDLRNEYIELINNSIKQTLPQTDLKNYNEVLNRNAYKELKSSLNKGVKPGKHEFWFTASSIINSINKGKTSDPYYNTLFESLKKNGRVKKFFNKSLFSKSDSSEPENAGILGALVGSLITITVCLMIALPIGVMSGIFLSEFMSKNSLLTSIIEISINNLAAVPSIIFGVVGLALYLGIFGLPRSSPLVGGMTLALMVLPNIIITTKNAFASVPIIIKDAAFAIGASNIKVILDHSLPIAIPRIIHGTILGIARVLGESSPLLMIGMVAFIVDIPKSFLDPATVLPVQIYIWSNSPEIASTELAAIAIIALLLILFTLNLIANFVKRKFESLNFS